LHEDVHKLLCTPGAQLAKYASQRNVLLTKCHKSQAQHNFALGIRALEINK